MNCSVVRQRGHSSSCCMGLAFTFKADLYCLPVLTWCPDGRSAVRAVSSLTVA